MNKLTNKAFNQLNKINKDGHNNIYKTDNIEKALNRLKEYEELGVMPETVAYLLKFFKERTSAEYITQEMKFISEYLKAIDELSQLHLTKVGIKLDNSN